MLRRVVLYAFLLLAVAGALTWYLFFNPGVILGPAASIMNNADSIEVVRLAPDDLRIYFPPQQAVTQDRFFEGIPLAATADSKALGPSYQQRAARAIKDAV